MTLLRSRSYGGQASYGGQEVKREKQTSNIQPAFVETTAGKHRTQNEEIKETRRGEEC